MWPASYDGAMTQRHVLFTAGAGLAALTFACLLGATGADRPNRIPLVLAQMPPDGSTSLPSLQPVERAFIIQELQNCRTQADLARLAVSQAGSSQVRDFAQQLVGDYRQINVTLENIAQRKGVVVPPAAPSVSAEYRRLAATSGASFDRAFVRELAAANERILRLCESAVANAADPDVRETAGSFLPVVRDHINKTTELLKVR